MDTVEFLITHLDAAGQIFQSDRTHRKPGEERVALAAVERGHSGGMAHR
ncbi:Uncharacterised protein [Mycobacteroides abscessus subsp. abscessus]|nr:Uncharacterised protein [Mycobacteroides abscessus subsp. abscessus]SLC84281.1 Uncharacterised protein [Mycobacteroides abscessus subsp. massiliense]